MRALYICTGNSFRSPGAEALTRKHHPEIEVESAGTDAVEHTAENLKDLLDEKDAKQFLKPSPDQVSQRALDEADKVICMMSGHKKYLQDNFDVSSDKLEVWGLADPIKPGIVPEKVLSKIEQRVIEL